MPGMEEHHKTKVRHHKEKVVAVEEEEEEDENAAVSFLEPDTVRWMNKRRARSKVTFDGTTVASDAKPLVTPSQAIYLRSIFKGLDYDNMGHISLAELSAAVKYVSKKSDGKIFSDPDKIITFFKDMDIDGNGNVDLNEFLIGMTAQSSGKDNVMGDKNLQKSFSDFATLHRRKKILANLTDNSNNVSEMTRYANLHKLFGLNYLPEDTEDTLILHGNVNDQIEHAKEELGLYKRDIACDYLKKKKHQCQLARGAALHFQAERERLGQGQRHNNVFTDPRITAEIGSGLSPVKERNHHRFDYSIEKSLVATASSKSGAAAATETEATARRLERRVNERLSAYGLLSGPSLSMHKTFTPPVESFLANSMSDPHLTTCFGPLTSGGMKITASSSELRRHLRGGGSRGFRKSDVGMGVGGAAEKSQHRRQLLTRNLPLEMRLVSQTVRRSASAAVLPSSKSAAAPILQPISNRDRMKK